LIWIRAKVEHRSCFLENAIIHLEFLIPWTPKDRYTIPIQSLEFKRWIYSTQSIHGTPKNAYKTHI
jgi:hypothetical protein